MARDVTLQRQLEAHFRQEQKMEALGLMAGGIAHDFGNLMATLQLGARVLRDRVPADDPLRMLADEIVSHADRGTTLTRQLLAFSRRQPGTVERVDLNEVLRDMEKVLRRVVGPDARLDLDLTPGLDAFLGDRAQVEQVVLNLVLNARDATEGRGRVSVATRALTIASRGSGAWTAASPGRYVALSVTDDGPGVDAATQRKIFDPFFTTKPEGKGTGLGLATVFSIAQQHRGAVRCESAPGQGARFEVILPAAPARQGG
ncbi:MAG: ATP-binding protein [Polyangiales bacterium]